MADMSKHCPTGPLAADGQPPLRIVMVGSPWYEMPPSGYGGIEAMVTDLIAGLVARGHHVTAIGVGHNTTAATVQLTTYDQAPSHRIFDRWPEIVHALASHEIITELLDRHEVDIVHDHSAAGPLLADSRSLPTVVTTHNPLQGAPGTDHHDIARTYTMLSDLSQVRLVAITDAQRQLAPQLSWAGVVPNALHVNEFAFNADKDDFVLYLGRMFPYKGAHHAIAAAQAVGIPLVMAGRCADEEEKQYFAEQIEPRLGPDVEWRGEISNEEKMDLLRRAKALLFPITWHEPFGLVMIEAMASGTPVVALRHGSVPEVVADGVSGVICEVPEELPDGLRRAFTLDPAACRAHVEANFDIDAMARGYERVYREILARRTVLRSAS